MKRETFRLTSDGLKLWAEIYRPDSKAPKLPGLIVCHGIPAAPYNPSDQGYQELAEKLCADGFLTLIFNFRGAGESEGNFDILGWSRDLGAAVDYLCSRSEMDPKRLAVLGFSGGAATAICVAARDKRVTSVASAASPARFGETEKDRQALLAHARKVGIIRDKGFPTSFEEWSHGFETVRPADWVGKISPRPVLILHGEKDDVVPVNQARELYRQAHEPKDLRTLPGVGHRLRLDERAMSVAREWLKKTNRLG